MATKKTLPTKKKSVEKVEEKSPIKNEVEIPVEVLKLSERLDRLDKFIQTLRDEDQKFLPEDALKMLLHKARHLAFSNCNDDTAAKPLIWMIGVLLYNHDAFFNAVRPTKE